MIHLLIYAGKVAAVLLVFYCFYRFLLKRETFHRLNRLVLVGTALLSFLLPLCIITIHRPLAWAGAVAAPAAELTAELAPVLEKSQPWWLPALSVLFWGGVAFVLVRGLISVFSRRTGAGGRRLQDYRYGSGHSPFQLDALHRPVPGRLGGGADAYPGP